MTQKLNMIAKAVLVTSGTFIAAVSCTPAAAPSRGGSPVAAAPAATLASAPAFTATAAPGRGARGQAPVPNELAPDDKPAFPDPPAGFNVKRDNIATGKMTTVAYDSKSLGTRRNIYVFIPHVWNVDGHAHDGPEFASNLYLFAPFLFK